MIESWNDREHRQAVSAILANPLPEAEDSPTALYPKPLGESAYHGLAGELVRAIEPHTESDPAALLVQFLAYFGSVIGRSAHWKVEADSHFTNLFVVVVGSTSKGRKGTSLGHIEHLFSTIDAHWSDSRIVSGLSTGEGLIFAVRDPIHQPVPRKEKGQVVGSEIVEVDPGIADKRLLVIEPEFARVLQTSERQANTLSAICRQAWDTGKLRVMTRTNPTVATGAHISIVGHVTKAELQRQLSDTAVANGFGNRFLFCCATRSKLLPRGGNLSQVNFAPLLRRLDSAVRFGQAASLVERDNDAWELWDRVYPALSEPGDGISGAITARSEAQTVRLACIYALLDHSRVIRVDHLKAGLEVWRYCRDSANYIFGNALGDPFADQLLALLRGEPLGATRTEISKHFANNKTANEINAALNRLAEKGLAGPLQDDQAFHSSTSRRGRKAERWVATQGTAPKNKALPRPVVGGQTPLTNGSGRATVE